MTVVVVVGQTVTLTWKASVDELATLTVTKPDGTTTTATVTNTAIAQSATFVPTLPGRHQLLWATSEDQHPDILDVWPVDPRYLVSIDDAIDRLKLASTKTNSPETLDALGLSIAAATLVVESITGPILPSTKTWTVSGRSNQRNVVLPHDNCTVTGVTVDGTALNASAYVLAYDSIVVSDSFTEGDANIVIAYTVGSVTIPANIRQACLEIVAHMWQVTRQGMRGGASSPETELTPFGFAVPKRALEYLAPNYRLTGA